MSRNVRKVNDNITIVYGTDHAIGQFLDITDKRYAQSGFDEQGEGYVCEHSSMFPYDNSLIQLDFDEPITKEIIIKACDEFIEKLKSQKTENNE